MRFLLIVLATLAIDQVTKYLVQANMLHGETIPVLPPVFYLTYIQNPGAAFGILAHQTLFFIVVTILVIAGIVLAQRYMSQVTETVRVALGMITGGALGNLIDRLRVGKVIDFLDFRVWPVFNLADTAIVLGAGLLVWYVWKSGRDEEKVEKSDV